MNLSFGWSFFVISIQFGIAWCCRGGGSRFTLPGRGGGTPSRGSGLSRGGNALARALGGDFKIRDWKNYRGNGPTRQSSDINCGVAGQSECKWSNVRRQDRFDWHQASGQPELARWQYATGTQELPDGTYMILASRPRQPSDEAWLVSETIATQEGDFGEITFKHWRSQARNENDVPKLEVCVLKKGSDSLDICQEIKTPDPGPSSMIFPSPIQGPFQFVLKGYNFVNRPEGGFIVVDDFEYRAELAGGSAPPPPKKPQPPPNAPSGTELDDSSNSGTAADADACRKIACNFDTDDILCGFETSGQGSVGVGQSRGWEKTTGRLNRGNPLTGIKNGPDGTKDSAFLMADYPDPRRSGKADLDIAYVLETPQVTFSRSYFMNFKKFLAAEGLVINICRDAQRSNCIYQSPPLARHDEALRNRKWSDETIELPAGSYQLFIHTTNTGTRYNVGQVGIAGMRIYKDPGLGAPLCTP